MSTRIPVLVSICLGLCSLRPPPCAAEELPSAEPRPPSEEAPPPALQPAFVRLGPDGSAAMLDLAFLRAGEQYVRRLDAQLGFVARRGLGGYLEVAADSYEGGGGLGNLDLGVLLRRPSFTARLGVVVPTMTDESEELVETQILDPSDIVRGLDGTTSLRLAVSPSARHGNLVVRCDAGVDLPNDVPDLLALVHVDGGVGLIGEAGLGGAFELQLLVPVVDDVDVSSFISATASVQYSTPRVTGVLGLSTSMRDDARDLVPYTLNLAARVPLGR